LLALLAALCVAAGASGATKDLVVTVTATPNPSDNSTVEFNMTATNTGNSTAGPVKAQLYIDGAAQGPLYNYGNLQSNESGSSLQSLVMFCGWHTINATVDPADQVVEDNESNNNFTMQLAVVPYLNFTTVLSGSLGDYNVTLNASQSHGCEPITFTWELDGLRKTGAEVTYNPPAGTLPFTLDATPATPTLATTRSGSVFVPNLGPSLTVGLPNNTLPTLTPLQLAVDAVDQDGTVASYFIDFGDGNTSTVLGAGASYRYHASGTFTVLVRVTDNLGATNETTVVVTVTNRAPVADLADNFWVARLGERVEFNASGSNDPEGGGLSFSWDFGDGSTATGPVVNHSFSRPGSYRVNVTVTDAKGASSTMTETVTVLDNSGTNGGDIILWGLLLLVLIVAAVLTFYFITRRRKDEEATPPAPGEGSSGKPPSG